MKKLVPLFLAIFIIFTFSIACVACEKHEHTYSSEWTYDSLNHWHDSTCEHFDHVSEKGPHHYENNCDRTCNTCNYTREESSHYFDNVCDANCNECGAVRTVPDHVYDNACDKTCNNCGAERTVSPHVYDNDCDPTCNICNDIRTTNPHVYDNACDTTCNVCGAHRAQNSHVYDNLCDTTCNECGEEREVPDHVYDDDEDALCNECGYKRKINRPVLEKTINPIEYDGNTHSFTIAELIEDENRLLEGADVNYQYSSNPNYPNWSDVSYILNPGLYRAVVTKAEDEDYLEYIGYIEITITKKTISLGNVDVKYNGTTSFQIDLSDYYEGLKVVIVMYSEEVTTEYISCSYTYFTGVGTDYFILDSDTLRVKINE